MTCASCVASMTASIKKHVKKIPGVRNVMVAQIAAHLVLKCQSFDYTTTKARSSSTQVHHHDLLHGGDEPGRPQAQ